VIAWSRMSLLLLFPHPSPGVVHTTPSPVQMQAIETVIPSLIFVQETDFTQELTDTTYNASSVTYNESDQRYGGANHERGGRPEILDIETVIPTMDEDGEL